MVVRATSCPSFTINPQSLLTEALPWCSLCRAITISASSRVRRGGRPVRPRPLRPTGARAPVWDVPLLPPFLQQASHCAPRDTSESLASSAAGVFGHPPYLGLWADMLGHHGHKVAHLRGGQLRAGRRELGGVASSTNPPPLPCPSSPPSGPALSMGAFPRCQDKPPQPRASATSLGDLRRRGGGARCPGFGGGRRVTCRM